MAFAELLRFCAVGLLVFSLDTGIFLSLYGLGFSAILANPISSATGFFTGLYGHNRFTFQNTDAVTRPVAVRYGMLAAFNTTLGTIVIKRLLTLGMAALYAKILTTFLLVLISYLTSKKFVFR